MNNFVSYIWEMYIKAESYSNPCIVHQLHNGVALHYNMLIVCKIGSQLGLDKLFDFSALSRMTAV